MKKLAFCAFVIIAFASCRQKLTVYEKMTPEEKWRIIEEYFMVPGASASAERPLPNVLSEREVLLKAADFAIEEGVLDPSYYEYENNPALKDAKIETPVLMTNVVNGIPDMYILNAVDENGIILARISVSSNPADVSKESFVLGRSIPGPAGSMIHMITKKEAAELIHSQFPDKTVSEPMMIGNLRVGVNRYSHIALLWYFTVSDDARSAEGAGGDYVIDAYVGGYWVTLEGPISRNAAALNRGATPYLEGYRMVKLDRQLHLFDKLDTARSAGGVTFTSPPSSMERIGFTPVLLK
jgi:hypothetical protein